MSPLYNPTLGAGPRMIVGRYYPTGTPAGAAYVGGFAMTQNTVYYVPFLAGAASRIDRVSWECTTAIASTVMRSGIYRDNGGKPWTLHVEADGTIATSSTGFNQAVFTTPVPIAANELVWVAVVSQEGAGGVGVDSHASAVKEYVGRTAGDTSSTYGSYTEAGVTGALPGTATIAAEGNAAAPGLGLRGA